MLTIKQEIKRMEAVLNGEIVEGLKLGDPGLDREWVEARIDNLRMLRPSLDDLVEDILDIARENPIDDARVIIRDRIMKDAVNAVQDGRET